MKTFLNRQVVITEDGSTSIFLPELNEHYHSIHGAVQESKHVFMEKGWREIQDSRLKIQNSAEIISILEIGFGTGLNAFLVLKECLFDSGKKVKYVSIEKFPVTKEEVSQLNYSQEENEKKYFHKLHDAEWNMEENILANFSLKKVNVALEEFIPEKENFDLIFFDTFSPDKQPELWTEEVFRKMFGAMKQNGILVTYCAKGQVRRNLIAAGFMVERLDGPPGKREMLRARK